MSRLNLSLLLLCALLGIAQIWFSFLRNSNARALHDTHESIISQQEDIEQLKVEVASLMRPERLRHVAHEQLGMRTPQPRQFMHWPSANNEAVAP